MFDVLFGSIECYKGLKIQKNNEYIDQYYCFKTIMSWEGDPDTH